MDQEEKQVHWGPLYLDTFEVVLGDAIPREGPPIALSRDEPIHTEAYPSVVHFEAARKERRRRDDLLLNGEEREERLLEEGFSLRDIRCATLTALAGQLRREASARDGIHTADEIYEEQSLQHAGKKRRRVSDALKSTSRAIRDIFTIPHKNQSIAQTA